MARHKDSNWKLPEVTEPGHGFLSVTIAVLMDLRDELKEIKSILNCPNARDLAPLLRRIARNTARRRRTGGVRKRR